MATKFMLFLMVYNVGLLFVFPFVVIVLNNIFGIDIVGMERMVLTIILQLVMFMLPLMIWLKIKGQRFMDYMPRERLDGRNILYIVLLSFLVMPAMMVVSGITTIFVDNNVGEFMAEATGAGTSWLLMMLAIAVTPSIVEEVLFRGYIQSTTPKHLSFKKIALLNGLLFAIMHMSLHQFMYTFLLGVVLAYMVHYTKSIWAGILSHFVINGSQVTLAHWAMSSYQNMNQSGASYAMAQESIPQIFYDAFVETDPALAQRMYDLLAGMNVEMIALGILFVFAIGATIGFVALFKSFLFYNRARVAEEISAVEPSVEETAVEMPYADNFASTLPPPVVLPQRLLRDKYLYGVILIYIIIMTLTTVF